jgi:four helix bundle protein
VGRTYDGSWIDRSHDFAVRVLRIADKLPRTAAGFTVGGQIARSSTSIPFNLEEAKCAQTEPDTLNKTVIARKEAAETRRALMVIRDVPLLPASQGQELSDLITESHELVAMLTAGTMRLQARIAKKGRRPPNREA